MTNFLKFGDNFVLASEERLDIHKTLPVGNYSVRFDEMKNEFFLQIVEQFSEKKKIYGNTPKIADRIINTYEHRGTNTGALFVGEKGSGKTLLTKLLSIKCAERKIPTIIINAPWEGDIFNRFMQQIEQPCMVLFDEFEKVYSSEKQQQILTLLDGVYPSKKLFVLTCNLQYRIDEHMRNRPGRLFYMLEFNAIEPEAVLEYCNDNLHNKDYIEEIVKITKLFSGFNFDMLTALVEESNRYKESPMDAVLLLNIKPTYESRDTFKTSLTFEGVPLLSNKFYPNEVSLQPFSDNRIDMYIKKSPADNAAKNIEDDEDDDATWYGFNIGDMEKFDPQTGEYVYSKIDHGKKITLTLKRKEKTYINPYAF